MNEQTKDGDAKVNILLVDDQPAKLLSYELILEPLGENLLKASSAQQALEILIKNDVAVILIDVCMPDLNGFELAQMIREHPRFKQTSIIFVSAIHLSTGDSLKGYELGGVDYVPVPVVAAVLQAKVRVFVDLFRKTRALAQLNAELERRVEERTLELQKVIAHQELLAREVDHRARNALAVIQSIVGLTPSADPQRFVDSVTGRISAMARAHNLLSESRWLGADLLSLVKEELAPFDRAGATFIDGPPAAIAPAVAQSFALSLHELATNAAKYGALSRPGGRLSVSWTLDAQSLHLDWVEECPFAIGAPNPPGFGSKVIDAGIETQLGGAIERRWRADGVAFAITVPARHFASAPSPPPHERRPREPRPDPKRLRVMVVDDEPLIAMMTGDMVAALGAAVVGPYTDVEAAEAALVGGRVDAALLDINMSGALCYELADRLAERKLPFAFVTGYQPKALPPRFSAVPVLTKPLDEDGLADVLSALAAGRLAARAALAS